MEFKDYYAIMGVARDATQDEIKRAYRRLARKYHPDVSKERDAEARFKEVGEAYEVLKDPEKRAAYDQLGANWKAGQDFRPPPDWDQGFAFHGGGFTRDGASQFSDFFESLFGRGFSTAGHGHGGFRARGEDVHAKVVIDLDDAFRGATRALTLKATELGADGRPRVRERTLNVRIPKGVREGQQIRLTGQGDPGRAGGDAGDLYLEVAFRAHPFYHAEGRDVYIDLPVAPWELALGASVTAPTPAGPVSLRIPENSKEGGKLRLKGRGIPGTPPGDLYAVLKVTLPPADSEAARVAYRELQRQLDFNPRARLGV
ncbi:MAG: DnaJ domain-containing protein [Gammaproteobacteria bacterium]|nr:DnaJ domain-containing protein [Gammaproteobacteria bacterium]